MYIYFPTILYLPPNKKGSEKPRYLLVFKAIGQEKGNLYMFYGNQGYSTRQKNNACFDTVKRT